MEVDKEEKPVQVEAVAPNLEQPEPRQSIMSIKNEPEVIKTIVPTGQKGRKMLVTRSALRKATTVVMSSDSDSDEE